MSLDLKDSSQLASNDCSIHQLEGQAFWRWWQLSQAFRLFPSKSPDPLESNVLRALSMFLILFPVQIGLTVYLINPSSLHGQQLVVFERMMVLSATVWLTNLWLFYSSFKKHQRIAQKVTVTPEVIEITSPFFKQRMHWFEIEEIFPFMDVESGIEMHQITSTRGEWFILPPLISNRDQLITLIKNKVAPDSNGSHQFNYRLSDSSLDGVMIALAEVFMTISFVLLKEFKIPTLSELTGVTLLFVMLFGLHWLCKEKIPQLVRIKKSDVFLQTRSKKYVIPIEQILENKKFGKSLIFRTRTNWFMVAFLRKEQREKLLETSKLEVALR